MRVLLDTNVLLDVVDTARPHTKASVLFYELCQAGLIFAYASVLSVANMQYILRKTTSFAKIEKAYKIIAKVVEFEDLKAEDVIRGFEMGFSDYEDALQAICAERVGADYIITEDVKDFKNSPVMAITPEEFFEKNFVAAKI